MAGKCPEVTLKITWGAHYKHKAFIEVSNLQSLEMSMWYVAYDTYTSEHICRLQYC